jgi:hypothetical protein
MAATWVDDGCCSGGMLGHDPSNRLVLCYAKEPPMVSALRTTSATGGAIAHHQMHHMGNMFAHKHARGLLHHGGMVIGGGHRDILRRIFNALKAAYPHMGDFMRAGVPVGTALYNGWMDNSGLKRARMD